MVRTPPSPLCEWLGPEINLPDLDGLAGYLGLSGNGSIQGSDENGHAQNGSERSHPRKEIFHVQLSPLSCGIENLVLPREAASARSILGLTLSQSKAGE